MGWGGGGHEGQVIPSPFPPNESLASFRKMLAAQEAMLTVLNPSRMSLGYSGFAALNPEPDILCMINSELRVWIRADTLTL